MKEKRKKTIADEAESFSNSVTVKKDDLFFIAAGPKHGENYVHFEGHMTDLTYAFTKLADDHREFVDIMGVAILSSDNLPNKKVIKAFIEKFGNLLNTNQEAS